MWRASEKAPPFPGGLNVVSPYNNIHLTVFHLPVWGVWGAKDLWGRGLRPKPSPLGYASGFSVLVTFSPELSLFAILSLNWQ